MHPATVKKLNEFLEAAEERLWNLNAKVKSGSEQWELVQKALAQLNASRSIVQLERERP